VRAARAVPANRGRHPRHAARRRRHRPALACRSLPRRPSLSALAVGPRCRCRPSLSLSAFPCLTGAGGVAWAVARVAQEHARGTGEHVRVARACATGRRRRSCTRAVAPGARAGERGRRPCGVTSRRAGRRAGVKSSS
jgi:hypothetical protein